MKQRPNTEPAPLRAHDNPLFAAAKTASTCIEFQGGARRTGAKPLYHLVPLELMEAVANTRAEGDLKYEPGNWQQGGKAFFIDCINHTIEHLMKAGDMESPEEIETHFGHAACNIGFMLWALRRGLITRPDFRRAAEILLEGVEC